MVLLLLQLEKVLAKLALQARAVVEVRHRLAAYFFVKSPDFGLFKCIVLRVRCKAICHLVHVRGLQGPGGRRCLQE